MPAPLADILAELDALLEPERFEDYCPNGLQVPGRPSVETIATGVSASAELFELAAAERAELLLVHHGLFWGAGSGTDRRRAQAPPEAAVRRGHRARRLPPAARRAPELGNNALLARALGAETLEPFALHRGEPIGFLAPAALAGRRARMPIGWPRCRANGSSVSAPSAWASSALLPNSRMRVQRQVVGGERDVRVEQDLQAALERGVDRPGPGPQKRPWCTSSSWARSAAASSKSSTWPTRRSRSSRPRPARDLQSVGTVVLEARRFEQAVEPLQDVGRRRRAPGEDSGRRRYGILTAHRGVAQPGSAHRSGR